MIVRKHALSLGLILALGCASTSSDAPPPQPPTTTADEATKEAVDPVPEDFHSLTPEIVVTDVDAAIGFYEKAFGAKKLMALPGPDGKTMHGEVKVGDSIVMIDAENPGMKAPTTLGGTPATLMLYVPNVDEVYEAALETGAKEQHAPEDQFWGDRYGEVIDPSGHRWGIATHVEDLSDEQMGQRAQLAMADMTPPTEGDPKADKKKADKKKADKKKADKKKAEPKKAEPKWKSVAGTPAKEPVPSDYHSVTMLLTTSDAAKAIEFYKQAFGATERNRMPMPDGKLMHAEVKIGDSVLMLADEFPMEGAPKSASTLGGSPVMIHMYVPDADGTFASASESGGTALMQPHDAFWGDRYAAIVDPVGMPWGIATHVEDLSPEEMAQRAKAAMATEDQPSAEGQPSAEKPAS